MRTAALLALLALVACSSRSPAPARPPMRVRPGDQLLLYRLAGGWRWLHATIVDNTYRVERERWLFDPITTDEPTGAAMVRGRYRRDVVIVALDGKAFLCNQRTAYIQSTVYDLRVIVDDHHLVVDELDYRILPSPCEPGFRHRTHYTGRFDGPYLALTWAGGEGEQTLSPVTGTHADGTDVFTAAQLELPALPSDPAGRLAGAWHWSLRGRDRGNDIRDEDESWEIAVSTDGTAAATYVRDVTIHSGDGARFACSGATSYTFTDRYTLRGTVDGGILALDEVAVDPGTHPCLANSTARHLDSMSAIAIGEHLIVTWRGKRQQVLHRE